MHARGSLGEAQAPWLSLGPVIHQHVARSQCQPYLEMKGPGTRTVLQTGTAQILKFNYQPTQPPAAARKKCVPHSAEANGAEAQGFVASISKGGQVE